MSAKILIASLPIGELWDAVDGASHLTKILRSHDRSLTNQDVLQFPIVDGGAGSIDFLVTRTLGSFLEVEATGANGEVVVAPMGFAGEDGKLAILEMSRVAAVTGPGASGTTFGVGELIQDVLDEGAFSVILGHEEPLACDAGLGAAAALGVKFLDSKGRELDMKQPDMLKKIAAVDASGRSFGLLSARFFIARSRSAADSSASSKLQEELVRLAEIFKKDAAIHAPLTDLSASAVEFGLTAFLGAERKDGTDLILEASGIEAAMASGEIASMIILANDRSSLAEPGAKQLVELSKTHNLPTVLLSVSASEKKAPASLRHVQERCLADIALFQAPLTPNSGAEERRRDLTMRLEKIAPSVLEAIKSADVSA
jgi:glycerate kinase